MKKEDIKLCRYCQNFLEFEKEMVECDYGLFENMKKDDTLIYTPEQFDCPWYEKHL